MQTPRSLDEQSDLERQQHVAEAVSPEGLKESEPEFKDELEELLFEALDSIVNIPQLPHYQEIAKALRQGAMNESQQKHPHEFPLVYEYEYLRRKHLKSRHPWEDSLSRDIQSYERKVHATVEKNKAGLEIRDRREAFYWVHPSLIPHILKRISIDDVAQLDWETQEELIRYVQFLRFQYLLKPGNFQFDSINYMSEDFGRIPLTEMVLALMRSKLKQKYRNEFADIEDFNEADKDRMVADRTEFEEREARAVSKILLGSVAAVVLAMGACGLSDCPNELSKPGTMVPDLAPRPAPINR